MNKKKLPNIIILMILTLITTIFWVSFNIYREFVEYEPLVVPEKILLQMSPKLDSETMNVMKNKIYP